MQVLPILLGGDLNAYGMALAFFEVGVAPSIVLGRYRLGATSFCRYIEVYTSEEMANEEGRLAMIRDAAARYPDRRPILIGCTDEYASFLIRNRERFNSHFFIPSPDQTALMYADKEQFGRSMALMGIRTPKTIVLPPRRAVPSSLPFAYPIVLKPASSEIYWQHPFARMRKVYFPATHAEAEQIVGRIRGSGYGGKLLLQEKLVALDTDNYVLTTYSDQRGRVGAAGFGRVLLEEHTPKGLGNHAAILTEKMPPLARRLLRFLNEMGYRGFANFDFLRDRESGELYVLEMNLRQGRSNHYLTAAGVNPAGLLLQELEKSEPPTFMETIADILWHSVPLSLVYAHVKDAALVRRLRELEAAGRAVSVFSSDRRAGFLRRLFIKEHERRILRRARTESE